MTVAGLVDAYLADPERAALRSKAEIERRLRKNVVPIIGAVKLAELRRRDVRNVTDTILRRGRKVEATRVFEDVRAMVRWAVRERISRRQSARRHGQAGRGRRRATAYSVTRKSHPLDRAAEGAGPVGAVPSGSSSSVL